MKNFDELLDMIKDKPVRTVAVAAADDDSVVEAEGDCEFGFNGKKHKELTTKGTK